MLAVRIKEGNLMSARDTIHIPVKNALIKDGWNITADPFTIQYDDVTLSADFGGDRTAYRRRTRGTQNCR